MRAGALIRFPPRRLLDGTVISSLPVAEAKAALAALGAAPAAAAGAVARAVIPAAAAAPATLASAHPPRAVLSDAEIDAIALGGAAA